MAISFIPIQGNNGDFDRNPYDTPRAEVTPPSAEMKSIATIHHDFHKAVSDQNSKAPEGIFMRFISRLRSKLQNRRREEAVNNLQRRWFTGFINDNGIELTNVSSIRTETASQKIIDEFLDSEATTLRSFLHDKKLYSNIKQNREALIMGILTDLKNLDNDSQGKTVERCVFENKVANNLLEAIERIYALLSFKKPSPGSLEAAFNDLYCETEMSRENCEEAEKTLEETMEGGGNAEELDLHLPLILATLSYKIVVEDNRESKTVLKNLIRTYASTISTNFSK